MSEIVLTRYISLYLKLIDVTSSSVTASNNRQLRVHETPSCSQLRTSASIALRTGRALASLFRTDSRNVLITLPGFSRQDITDKILEASGRREATVAPSPTTRDEPVASDVRVPIVTFVELDQTPKTETRL